MALVVLYRVNDTFFLIRRNPVRLGRRHLVADLFYRNRETNL